MADFKRAGGLATLAFIAGLSGLAASGSFTPAAAQAKTMTTASGLQIKDTVVGPSASPQTGRFNVIHSAE